MACAAPSGRQGRRGARRDAGTSGERLDAPCRPDSAALRVAPRRPPAASRASTVVPATLFGPLLADRTPGRDAGRDPGEKCGLVRIRFGWNRSRLFATPGAPEQAPYRGPPPGHPLRFNRRRIRRRPRGDGVNPSPGDAEPGSLRSRVARDRLFNALGRGLHATDKAAMLTYVSRETLAPGRIRSRAASWRRRPSGGRARRGCRAR